MSGSSECLTSNAKNRNISVQELLRAIVVPEWIREEDRTGLGLGER